MTISEKRGLYVGVSVNLHFQFDRRVSRSHFELRIQEDYPVHGTLPLKIRLRGLLIHADLWWGRKLSSANHVG